MILKCLKDETCPLVPTDLMRFLNHNNGVVDGISTRSIDEGAAFEHHG
jgi:hypothetical protein